MAGGASINFMKSYGALEPRYIIEPSGPPLEQSCPIGPCDKIYLISLESMISKKPNKILLDPVAPSVSY